MQAFVFGFENTAIFGDSQGPPFSQTIEQVREESRFTPDFLKMAKLVTKKRLPLYVARFREGVWSEDVLEYRQLLKDVLREKGIYAGILFPNLL